MEINFHVLQIEFEFRFAPSIFGEITGLGVSKFQRSNSFQDFFPKHLQIADIDLIFGMEITFHVLQIEFEFRYAPSIFGQIAGLGLSKFQQSNSFPDFFPKRLQIADIDLIFCMEINFHVLQIEFEFRYAPLIFGKIMGLRLSKFQRSNSFPEFFSKRLQILT